MKIDFDNTFATLGDAFYARQNPTAVAVPEMMAFNDHLAQEMGITVEDMSEAAQVFGGNSVPDGATPLAQLYAGHQFGSWNPQLGDGRAILLGEVVGKDGIRRDIVLKGAGQTPFSRNGDGRAWIGPVLREYLVSEAMHALGVPTTRALAAVSTGQKVQRETALPGGVITRVARSHLRVGTFQVYAARGQIDELKSLTDYATSRHYPNAEGPMGLLRAVVGAQSELIAHWLGLGFIHGVMNTDNVSIAGETIDYGPCAFMDQYHPNTVFSSIDRMGRYAYGNQADISVWNMAQLATALIQQADDPNVLVEEATEIVQAMPAQIEAAWLRIFGRKIGIANAQPDDRALIGELLATMADGQADFTNTFKALGTKKARDQFLDPVAFDLWESKWRTRLAGEQDAAQIMAATNPQRIPRNHQVEAMIDAAINGDLEPFNNILQAVVHPFEARDEWNVYGKAPTEGERVAATFCGT